MTPSFPAQRMLSPVELNLCVKFKWMVCVWKKERKWTEKQTQTLGPSPNLIVLGLAELFWKPRPHILCHSNGLSVKVFCKLIKFYTKALLPEGMKKTVGNPYLSDLEVSGDHLFLRLVFWRWLSQRDGKG